MNASVVLGQPDFTSISANQGGTAAANTLYRPTGVYINNGKMFVADRINSRILIYNSIPTTNNASADIVVGQSSFSGISTNQGGTANANTLANPWAVFSDGTRMYVSDYSNRRLLIWNTIPTANNASADVVVGQPNFTSTLDNQCGCLTPGAKTLKGPGGVWSDGNKLIIADSQNNRVLIYNSIPTSNNASADVVVGQADFTHKSVNQGGSAAANTLNSPIGIWVDNGKLFVTDSANNRILIFNSIPTTNNASTDVIVPNYGGTSTGGLAGIFTSSNRLFVSDITNNRVLIYNSIPTSSSATPDIVIGQPNFTVGSENQGGSAAANTLTSPRFIATDGTNLYVPNELVTAVSDNRILIFNNITSNPGLTLDNSPQGQPSGLTRLTGTATTNSIYSISSVQYSVNGGSLAGATPTSGFFDATHTGFYFDFDPKANQPQDSNGNLIDGYTVKVKSTNTNTDVTDNLFYFQPFDLNTPLDNTSVTTAYPTFAFAVSRQRTNMLNNLSKYQVQVKPGGSNSNASWQTLIDNIPIDFATVQTSDSNLQKNSYLGRDPTNGNGTYETAQFTVIYSVDSSHLQVQSKVTPLSGTYQWQIVAVDKSGHSQTAGPRNLYVNSGLGIYSSFFPLAVLNISGLGNPNLSTTNTFAGKTVFYLSTLTPTFYGIAYANATVTLQLGTKTYTTTVNPSSRFGINVPQGDLTWGTSYLATMSAALNDQYVELSRLTFNTFRSIASTLGVTTSNLVVPTSTPTILPTPNPTSVPQPTPSPVPPKHCFLFWCY